VQNLLKSETMWQYMLTGRLSSVFYARLKAHSRTFTNRMLGPVKAVIVLYMGADAYDVRAEQLLTHPSHAALPTGMGAHGIVCSVFRR